MKQVVPKRRPNIPVESILYDPSTFEYDKTHRYTAHAYHSDFLPHVLTGNVAGPGLTRQQDYANIQNELDEFSKSSVSYDSFKKKSVETTDLYGLGQALLIMRNNTRAYQGKVNVEGIEAVLRRCITPHVMRRFSVDEANRAIQKAFHPPTPPPLVKLFRSKSEPLRATKKVYIQQGVRSQTSPQKSKARFSLQKTRVSKARSSPQKTRSSPIKARTSPRKTRASPIKARTSPIKARASPQINF
jgi:hypothetical protein